MTTESSTDVVLIKFDDYDKPNPFEELGFDKDVDRHDPEFVKAVKKKNPEELYIQNIPGNRYAIYQEGLPWERCTYPGAVEWHNAKPGVKVMIWEYFDDSGEINPFNDTRKSFNIRFDRMEIANLEAAAYAKAAAYVKEIVNETDETYLAMVKDRVTQSSNDKDLIVSGSGGSPSIFKVDGPFMIQTHLGAESITNMSSLDWITV